MDETRRTMVTTAEEAFSRGFDIGNYASAYETEDYDVAEEQVGGDEPFLAGHLLGFFSSYELHEVPDDRREDVEHFRVKYEGWS